MKVLLYSSQLTSRLEYASRLLLQHILRTEISFIADKNAFINTEGAKINYSPQDIPGSLHIVPTSILFETSIHDVDPLFSYWENLPVLFFNSQNSELPFDPFAATFWMASRYEEYLPYEADRHGRFRASISLAFKNGFLNEPVVHRWAESLKKALKNKFPQFEPAAGKFTSLSTIDVDSAWTYLHKGFVRTTGAFARDLFSGRAGEISMRLKAILGLIKDPFESYDEFAETNKAMNTVPLWFFLLADYGKYDININPCSPALQKLIQRIASLADVGMHPSYRSVNSEKILEKEKKRLEAILNRPVAKSRQHFLKISFPETFRRLVKLGISEDYSMGYHDQPGFRTGMCTPYPWFDLLSDKQENLTIVPFMLMDRSFTEYLHLSPDEAYKIICTIIDNTAKVRGQFVSIWHNEPADSNNASAWFEVYKKMQGYVYELK